MNAKPQTASAEISGQNDTLFADLRAGFVAVAARAGQVKVREDRIAAFAASLPDQIPDNTYDDEHHFSGTLEDSVAYSLILDCLNFGSGYKPHLAAEGLKLVDGSIYFTVAARLKDYFLTRGVPAAAALADIDSGAVAGMLGIDEKGSYSQAFVDLCRQSLCDLGAAVTDKAGGDYLKYVIDTAPRAATMIRRLAEMKMFQDSASYKGHDVAFLKRAQHNVAVLNLLFNRHGRSLFDDAESLTMFADNAVPSILHAAGILEYTPALGHRIAAGDFIEAGSEEEIEIRACAAYAVELIAAAKGMSAVAIDFILWHSSVEDPLYSGRVPHRTLTPFY